MFREMRRKKQALGKEDYEAILRQGTSGVLALSGDAGYPYAVPLSYVYDGEKLYFHSAKSGHKIDALRRDPRASFCVIAQDKVVPAEYTTYFRSVIVFGELRILEDAGEKRSAMEKLARKYAPSATTEEEDAAIEKDLAPLCVLELTPHHISGKESIELVRAREGSTL